MEVKFRVKRFLITQSEYSEMRDSYDGLCIQCGYHQIGDCEPDARKYKCENCGLNGIYGIEELLISSSLIEIVGQE